MKKEMYELTNPQKSIWMTEQYQKGTSIGNIFGKISIHEKIDVAKLKLSIKEFVRRNDSMRTKLLIENGTPKQYFEDTPDFPINVVNLNSDEEVDKLALKYASTPLSLLNSLLFHFEIFVLPNGCGGFLVSIHHIIGDAWASGLLVSGIMDIYESFNEYKCYSYLDYINSEKEYLSSSKFDKDAIFWEKLFETVPLVPEIPSQKRLLINSDINYSSKREEFVLPKDFVAQINNLCSKYNVSIFNFFMAIYAIYTNRVCNLDDFVIGTPILNRSNYKEKLSTGMYVSTIPFKVHVDSTMSFPLFVQSISQDFRQVFRHQKYPYQNILQTLRKTNPKLPNLYDFLISYQNSKTDTKINSVPYESKWVQNGNVSDSLNIHLYDTNDFGSLNIAYDYQINKYSSQDIFDLHKRILTIINQLLENENICLQDIDILSNEDKINLEKNIISTKTDFSFCSSILEQIEKNAKDYKNQIAIETASENITYNELLR